MRCPRCNKQVKRKLWKQVRDCKKCKYNENCISDYDAFGFIYTFPTSKYIILVDKKYSYIYTKKSNQDIFVRRDAGGCKIYKYDFDTFVIKLCKQISKKVTDFDIEKYLAIR